jgi:inosine/xanthosine triphosphatase
MRVAVGSKNPLKRRAVAAVLRRIYPRAAVSAVEVDSGVSANPLSNEETLAGAIQRARSARRKTGARWGVGLEGGMAKISGRWFTCVWCAVWDGKKETVGGCVHCEVPPSVVRAIRSGGEEMGACMDRLAGMRLTKRKMGAEGILTGGRATREEGFRNAVLYALAPRITAKYYNFKSAIINPQ